MQTWSHGDDQIILTNTDHFNIWNYNYSAFIEGGLKRDAVNSNLSILECSIQYNYAMT